MSTKFVEAVSRRIGEGVSRRGFFRRAALVGSALAVSPWTYIAKPGSAYAAICNCAGQNCNCNDLCCRGYTEFCCTLTGSNTCPPGTVAAGWWKADGSGFCDVNGSPRPRYYLDCNMDNCGSCTCGPKGVCGPECTSCSCRCGDGDCRNRRECCVQFRYGQCNNQMPCLGPILCRVVTCTPPWEIDATCTQAVLTDNNTRYHDAPCLHPDETLHSWIVGGTLVVENQVHTHLASCEAVGSVRRIAGGSRYSTAAEVSRQFFPDAGAVDEVFVVTGVNFPDALTVGSIAAMRGAPILLTQPTGLPGSTREELQRVAPSRIVVVGGPNAVSEGVIGQLAGLAPNVDRIAGIDRYATAAELSREFFQPGAVDRVFIVTGENHPDGLAVVPAAAGDGAPVLLVGASVLPDATRDELLRLEPGEIVVVGGTSAVSEHVVAQLSSFATVSRIAGPNRYATAAALSKYAFPDVQPMTTFVVTGLTFPDALAVGPIAALTGGPVLLVTDSTVPGPTASELARLGGAPCPAL